MKKLKLNCVLVVEGKNDSNFLKQIFEVQTIETNGSALSAKTLNLIKQTASYCQIILLLDPDYQGQKIQQKILNFIPDCSICYVTKKDLNPNKKKIGIAEADSQKIKTKILNLIIDKDDDAKSSLDWGQYLSLNLNSKNKRKSLCDQLEIPYFNHKQLFKNLIIMGLTLQQIEEKIQHE